VVLDDLMARRLVFDPPNPNGLCWCGCGALTPLATNTNLKRGILRGSPVRYITGHQNLARSGVNSSSWKGGRIRRSSGYIHLRLPDRPDAVNGYVPEHRVVWEQANGRLLLPTEDVHHVNGVKDDNRPENLVALTRREHLRSHGHNTPGAHTSREQRLASLAKARAANSPEKMREGGRKGGLTKAANRRVNAD
jgi:hypothetical protein